LSTHGAYVLSRGRYPAFNFDDEETAEWKINESVAWEGDYGGIMDQVKCRTCPQLTPAREVNRTAFVGKWYSVLSTDGHWHSEIRNVRHCSSSHHITYNPQDNTRTDEIHSDKRSSIKHVTYAPIEGRDGVENATSPSFADFKFAYVTLVSSDPATNSWVAVHHCYSHADHPGETRLSQQITVYSRNKRFTKQAKKEAAGAIRNVLMKSMKRRAADAIMSNLLRVTCNM